MSVDLNVYLPRSNMPDTEQWASLVAKAARGVELPTDFNQHEHTGFLPCKFRGEVSGFEYYAGDLPAADIEDMELEPEYLTMMEGCDYSVLLVTRGSDTKDFKTAYLAGACLAHLSGGVLCDPHTGIYTPADKAYAEACDLLDSMDSMD